MINYGCKRCIKITFFHLMLKIHHASYLYRLPQTRHSTGMWGRVAPSTLSMTCNKVYRPTNVSKHFTSKLSLSPQDLCYTTLDLTD